jgi:hypothetical protein
MSDTGFSWAGGLSVFAGAMMLLTGILNFFQGLAAVVNDQFFVKVGEYAFKIDVTAWGWIHMVLGIAVAVIGLLVFTGAGWARMVGIGVVSLSAIANFLSLPYYPLWAIVLIALDVVVIWALASWNPAAARTL